VIVRRAPLVGPVRCHRRALLVASLALVSASGATAEAQELEPRAYAANPIGVRFAALSFGYSTGDVVFEPTSPITDVSAKVYLAALGLGGTFAMFGRTASLAAIVPYGWANVAGNVFEEARSAERSGLADARLRLGVNLFGGRALTLPQFVRRAPSTVIGTSLTISMPTGQYYADKLVNVGQHRWAFKPEIGISHPTGPWTLELSLGSWFFTRNGSYYGGTTKEQRPMHSVQSHVGYTIRPRLWVAADVTYYAGGRAVIDDVPAAERQENARLGLTVSLPVRRAHSVKVAWSKGAVTRLGGNFDTWLVAWQTTMFSRASRSGATQVQKSIRVTSRN